MGIVEKIKELKKKKNAIILAHNYQIPEVQDIADFLGDSLGLSIQASKTDADIIVFCGVYFMAETAKILSPKKTVLIPDKSAGCALADMITGAGLKEMKSKYARAKVLCYVNTPAEVKAESDLCCTSANALKMVKEVLMNESQIIFVPDENLGDYVSKQTGKDLILWPGYCPAHVKILAEDIIRQKKHYPLACVIVHPECRAEVIEFADAVLSTEGMCKYVRKSKAKEFIVGTEAGIIYRLKKENPGKEFYPANCEAICEDMKKINLEKVLSALEELKYEVVLPSHIISRSEVSIRKMLDYKD